jgi:putative transposase
VSLTCEVERPDPKPKEVRSEEDVVGVDLGLSSFATLSDGTKIDAPKPLAKKLRLVRRRSKQLSRKKNGSNNWKKAALSLARLHRKVKNAPSRLFTQAHHLAGENQASHRGGELERQRSLPAKTDLPVRGRCGMGYFPADAGVQGEVVRSDLIVAPRSFPSTRLCSRCGHLHGKIPLSQSESSVAKLVAWR